VSATKATSISTPGVYGIGTVSWGSRGSGFGAYYIIINSISTQFDDGLCFGEHDCSKHRPSSSVYTYTCALSAPSPPPPLPYLLGLYLPTARTPAVGRQSHEGSRSGLARRARSSAPGAGRITTTTTILTDLTDGRTDGRTDERTE